MISATIKGKQCNTIKDFYSIVIPKIKYSQCDKTIHLVSDFYDDFLISGKRLPEKNIVVEWHKLLTWYIDQPDATLFVRKYEGGKKNNEWDNRRGAVIQFNDGFEIAYASNFLAHDIFLMAYHGFVPSKNDFMSSIKNRELHITSGTKVEKEIKLYPSANKGLSYCYLAHIMDVNGEYLRDDGSYRRLSKPEVDWLFPRGVASDWKNSSDKVWHISRKLSNSEKELVKAHCIRFLDPMNYYLTPLTKHCRHTLTGFKKNIGEFSPLTFYIHQQYKNIFKDSYNHLIERGKFIEKKPKGYTGKEVINLEYSVDMVSPNDEDTSATTIFPEDVLLNPTKQGLPSAAEEFINELGDFMRTRSQLSERSVRIYLGRIKKLMDSGYSVNDICGEIDTMIAAHAKGGKSYNPTDSGNTSAALSQVKKMIQYPYICYNLGYQSFPQADEHITGYCIEGDTITISKTCGFSPLSDTVKVIPKKDLQKLIYILEEANKNFLFAKSNTCIRSAHGTNNYSYDYTYGRNSGKDCNALFKGNSTLALNLQTQYNDLIDKLTK